MSRTDLDDDLADVFRVKLILEKKPDVSDAKILALLKRPNTDKGQKSIQRIKAGRIVIKDDDLSSDQVEEIKAEVKSLDFNEGYTQEDLMRIMARMEIDGTFKSNKALAEQLGVPKTTIDHFTRSGPTRDRYTRVLEDMRKKSPAPERKAWSIDDLCNEVRKHFKEDEMWSDYANASIERRKKGTTSSLLYAILAMKLEKNEVSDVLAKVSQMGVEYKSTGISNIWNGNSKVYPRDLKETSMPTQVYQYIVAHERGSGVPSCEEVLSWWKQHGVPLKK